MLVISWEIQVKFRRSCFEYSDSSLDAVESQRGEAIYLVKNIHLIYCSSSANSGFSVVFF